MATTTSSDHERLAAALQRTAAENRVLATLYRWYTFYERDGASFDHQAELITDDFEITRPKESGLPSVTGKDAYRQSLLGQPPGQRNSHWLRTLSLEPRADGAPGARLTVTHAFQTVGPARTGAATLRYDAQIADLDETVPRFSALKESVLSLGGEPFQDAYAHNRAAAFVYRWLTLLERPGVGADPLRELLAPGFAMQLSSGERLESWDDVARWFGDIAGQTRASAHHVRDLVVDARAADMYQVSMTFWWEGIAARGGQPMTARIRHDWTLLDDGGRYARLAAFRAHVLSPFMPVPAVEALAQLERATTPG